MIITIENNNIGIDIKVDEKQKVCDVLLEVGKKRLVEWNEMNKLNSIRNNCSVCVEKTFFENEIYNGDILEIE